MDSVLENPTEGIAPTSSFLFQTNAFDQRDSSGPNPGSGL